MIYKFFYVVCRIRMEIVSDLYYFTPFCLLSKICKHLDENFFLKICDIAGGYFQILVNCVHCHDIKLQMNVQVICFSLLVFCFDVEEGAKYNEPVFKKFNPCCSMPCKHKGVCSPLSSELYECVCPKGYYGRSCEQASFPRWMLDKLNINKIKKHKLVSTGKLLWGVINNIPLLHDAALHHFYLSGSDLGSTDSHFWHYPSLGAYNNHSYFNRGLPPVSCDCPTPLGVKGPRTLPKVNEVFELLFRRKEFKPCPFGTNLMFVTFAQHLSYQFFKSNVLNELAFGSKLTDVSHMYGSDEAVRKALRSGRNGKLKARIINGEEYPPYLEDAPEVTMLYPISNGGKAVHPKWAMEHKMFSITSFMFAMATIWLREHNRICDIIAKEHPDWNDDRIYHTTRWIVLGELLTITAGEYFQHLSQTRLKLAYKPHLFHDDTLPTSSHMEYEFGLIFQWHQMLPDVFSVQEKSYNMSDLMFCNNRIVFENGLDAIINSMSRSPAGEITFQNCGKAFEKMMKKLIEEGRKTRLHSLNDYRRFYDLKPYTSFLELVGDKKMADILEELYGDVDAVEFVVGIFLEKRSGAVVPPTMIFLGGPVALRQVLSNPIGSSALWRPSTFGGKTGFDIVQKATLRKLFCSNLKGFCKNNVWVSFRTPWDITAVSRRKNLESRNKTHV